MVSLFGGVVSLPTCRRNAESRSRRPREASVYENEGEEAVVVLHGLDDLDMPARIARRRVRT
jgi:hypothetical protein